MRMHASWSGPNEPDRIQGCGSASCPDCKLPSTSSQIEARHGKPRSILKPDRSILPPCSEPSRCGLETAESVARSERRPTLTAPARAGVGAVRSGRKKAFGEVEPKKCGKEGTKSKVLQNMGLTSSVPYKDRPCGRPPKGRSSLTRPCAPCWREPHGRVGKSNPGRSRNWGFAGLVERSRLAGHGWRLWRGASRGFTSHPMHLRCVRPCRARWLTP